ncbi:MAG: hypothetical protein R3B98_00390 [Hyphomonas sp.]
MPRFRLRASAAGTAFVSAALLAVPALASGEEATANAQDAPLIIDTVTVTGRSPEQAKAFVDQVVDRNKPDEQLARWNRRVCTSVAGMRADQAQYLADRIASYAVQLGLQPEGPGCDPDILIYVSDDPDALAKALFDESRSLFAYYSERFIVTESRADLDAFMTTDRPVRWWRISQEMNDDGRPLQGVAGAVGAVVSKDVGGPLAISGLDAVAPVSDSPGSRVSLDTREELFRTIIIVDVNQVKGIPLSAVADYLSMVSLAQVSADLETVSQPSILNLFSKSPDVMITHAMTDWDADFLSSLYSIRANRSAVNQVAAIARNMERTPE